MAEPITRDDLRDVVTHEVRQHVTPYVLKLDNVADDVRMLKWTVYGNEAAGEAGLVKSMRSIQVKLDSLIESSAARDNQWKGIRNALIAVGTISSVPALQALGKLLGIWP